MENESVRVHFSERSSPVAGMRLKRLGISLKHKEFKMSAILINEALSPMTRETPAIDRKPAEPMTRGFLDELWHNVVSFSALIATIAIVLDLIYRR